MMETLHIESKAAINSLSKTKSPKSKIIDIDVEKVNYSFYDKSLLIGNYYAFAIDDVNNEQKIVGLILFHDLTDFLLWVHQPIVDIFGNIEKTLHISKCWDEEYYHLTLTIFSGLDDMDELTRLEKQLFEKLNNYPKIDRALNHVVIAQR